MKRLSNLLAALVFASLVIFMSCGGGGDDDNGPTEFEVAADNLTVSGWSPTSIQDPDGQNNPVEWDNFTLSFNGTEDGGSYTASGIPEGFGEVWGGTSTQVTVQGTWEFGNSSNVVVFNGNSATASISATQLQLEFNVTQARTNSIAGDWTFVFEPSTSD